LPALNSSAILSADFTPDPANDDMGTLMVTFASGRTYTHEMVPRDIYEELLEAPSAGSYYNVYIKGQF
jgi:hypothetical protein